MSGNADPGRIPPIIRAVGLSKRYRPEEPPVLNGFDLSIQPGEFFGLLGPNGAGKTTILSILGGLMRPDAGEVEVLGLSFARERRRIQQQIGIVPQEIALFEQLNAIENLRFFARLLGLSGALLEERLERCLAIAQLSGPPAKRPVGSYSGGMKRRLNLSAGLLGAPRILFLDEPTVGIDTQSRHLIHQELKRLHREGTTLLYTTHYMEEAQELCSRIAVIDQGTVILAGRPAELLGHGRYANLEDLFLEKTGKAIRDY